MTGRPTVSSRLNLRTRRVASDARLSRRASVMFSFQEPMVDANPFVNLLVASVEDSVNVRYFSWRELAVRPPDILHIQWPDAMVHSSSRFKKSLKAVLGSALLLVSRARGTKVLWTVHNLKPHEALPYSSRLFVRLVEKTVDHRVYINDSPENPNVKQSSTILHGSFRGWYGALTPEEREPSTGGFLMFGLLRRYKGVEDLVKAYDSLPAQSRIPLRVCGAPTDEPYAREVLALSDHIRGLQVRLEHLSDTELRDEIRRANLVVLPYRKLYNSGALLAALSVGRPVLAPKCPATESLRQEFGPAWVAMYEGTLGASDLVAALATTSISSTRSLPRMEGRSWVEVGRAHVALYKRLAGVPAAEANPSAPSKPG